MIYLITYDLKTQGVDYNAFYNEIKSIGNSYSHPLEALWFVNTSITAIDISNRLKKQMGANDLIYVHRIEKDCDRQGWLPKSSWEWLDKNF